MAFQLGDVVPGALSLHRPVHQSKQRPGVIVSSAAYHRELRDVILMAITSQVRRSGAFGEVIVQDRQAAKLLKPSAIKRVIATLEQALVIKTLGRPSQRDQHSLKEAITNVG